MEKKNDKKDVSILFNFTGTIFETSDPLMGLVNVGKPLLFYDRLSLEGFTKKTEEREEFIDNLIFDMQNMLESRALSRKDEDGRIRLIVAIDLAKGICPDDEKVEFCFPAQNARYFKERIANAFSKKTFDEEHRLINRFHYCFIFVDSSSNEQKLTRLYRENAFLGYSSMSDTNWITGGMVVELAQRIEKLRLSHFSISDSIHHELKNSDLYSQFERDLDSLLNDELLDKESNNILNLLSKVGLQDQFRSMLETKLSGCQSIIDLKKINLEEEIRSIITLLLGLGSEIFKDSTFFLLRVKNSPDTEKIKGEIYFKSLIQFVATIDDVSYRNKFLPPPSQNSPWYYTMDIANDSNPLAYINTEAFGSLGYYATQCKEQLEFLSWDPRDKKVEYVHYKLNITDPKEQDSYRDRNDKLSAERSAKREAFLEARGIPFFFGQKVGDWRWYKKVLATVWDLYHFEKENDRPLYDAPKRVTDAQMPIDKTISSSYSDLEIERNRLEKEEMEEMPMENYRQYQKDRNDEMNQFSEAIEEMKNQMVKLGFFSRLFWISIISSIVFTLCFTFHYFYNSFDDNPLWIAFCLACISLFFVIGAIVAQSSVKSKIRSAYNKIDLICDNLQHLLEAYLQKVYDRSQHQNNADVRKKNLDEMNAKLAIFNGHNKQVEIWDNFYKGIVNKIQKYNESFREDAHVGPTEYDDNAINIEDVDFKLPMPPRILDKIRNEFSSMKIQFMDSEVENVTCFIKQFKFTRLPR